MDEPLRRAIHQRATVAELRTLALGAGMTTLLQDGIEKALTGETTIRRVLAVCSR